MQTVIVVIHLMVVATMIGVVLLQKSEGGGLGIGSTGGFLSSRGTSNVLTRTTAILAGVFFATSLVLSVLAGGIANRIPSFRGHRRNNGTPGPSGQGGGSLIRWARQTEQPPAPAPGTAGPASQ